MLEPELEPLEREPERLAGLGVGWVLGVWVGSLLLRTLVCVSC